MSWDIFIKDILHSGPLVLALFSTASLAVVLFLLLALRRFPTQSHFFSPLLFVALIPYLVGALISFLLLRSFIGIEKAFGMWDGDLFSRLRLVAAPFQFLSSASIVMLLLYCVRYALSRRTTNA